MYKKNMPLADERRGVELATDFSVARQEYLYADKEEVEKKKEALVISWKTFCDFVLEKPDQFPDVFALPKEKVSEVVGGFFVRSSQIRE